MFDKVHRGHRKSGTIHHASDVAVQFYVIEIVLPGFDFERFLLIGIVVLADIGMPVEAVVIEVDLGIEGDYLPVCSHNKRVDLCQTCIGLDESTGQCDKESGRVTGLFALQTHRIGKFACLVR